MTGTSSAPIPTARSSGCPFDPAVGYAELRAEPGIAQASCPAGVDAWVVTRYADVRTALSDPRVSSRVAVSTHMTPNADLDGKAGPGSIIHADGAEHARLRRMLTPEFTVRRINAMRPAIGQIIDDHIDAMLAGPKPADLHADFALPIPSLVICNLLGVPYEDRAEFQERTRILVTVDGDPAQQQQSARLVQEFVARLVHNKMRDPGDDLLSRLIARGEASDLPLTIQELVTLGISLLVAGHETTANMITLSTLALLRDPEQLAALRADPNVAAPAVEEMLRYLTIVQFGLFRQVTDDLPLGEQTIPAGGWLVAALASGNRDSSVYADPDRLDLTRKSATHLAFGFGPHQCIGQQLARVELQETFARLHQRIPTLRLGVPVDDLRWKRDTLVYGVDALPVTWG